MDYKKLMKSKGLTQKEVSDKLGVASSTFWRIMKNPDDSLSRNQYKTLMDILGIDLSKNLALVQEGFGLFSVPYYEDVRASMGNGEINHESSVRRIAFDDNFLRDVYRIYSIKGLSLINTFGDSMAPTIPSESVVFVQEGVDIFDGTICAVMLDKELYIKRLQKKPTLKLISDNKAYDDIYIKEGDDFIILGKVLGIFKRL
jgi:phage repressor protein C with HTH and peptisase S24 domain